MQVLQCMLYNLSKNLINIIIHCTYIFLDVFAGASFKRRGKKFKIIKVELIFSQSFKNIVHILFFTKINCLLSSNINRQYISTNLKVSISIKIICN